MKNLSLLLLFFSSFCAVSQISPGNWKGKLSAMGTTQEIYLSVEKSNSTYQVFLIAPSNPEVKFPCDSVAVSDSSFYFSLAKLGIVYEGRPAKDSLIGEFRQNGFVLNLLMSPSKIKPEKPKRPQTPVGEQDYYTEEILVENTSDSLTLSGTLTLPSDSGKFPVVILVSGSGPQNRDSEIFGHKPFAVIADHLAKQGIGSFRYDERGVGRSSGEFQGADLEDLYSDLTAVVEVIQERKEVSKLGILGHSEGGILAPKFASQNKKQIEFVVMMGAPGMPIKDMMHLQREALYKNQGLSKELIEEQKRLFTYIDSVVLSKSGGEKSLQLKKVLMDFADEKGMSEAEKMTFLSSQFDQLDGAWYKSFVSVVPEDYLKKMKCSVLVLGGGKDVQVPSSENMKAIGSALKKSRSRLFAPRTIQFVKYGELNHLLQPCETGMPDEYQKIETTISRDVLFSLSDFINSL
jgi:pimeloyl-ACP methyl ester carboxylesterase